MVIAEQNFHTTLGLIEDLCSSLAQGHAFLEAAQPILERDVSPFESLYKCTQSKQQLIESLRCGCFGCRDPCRRGAAHCW